MRAFYFCLLLLCPAISSAQDAKDAKDLKKVSCRLLGLDSSAPPPPLLNVADKDTAVACSVTTAALSPATVCFAKGNAINFVTAADRKLAATAIIPANVKTVILVFVRASKTTDIPPWRVFVIDDSAKNFPDGGAFVANFHNQDIRFVIGERKLMLHSAGSYGLPIPAKRDAFNMAPVVFEFQQDDRWRTASESMLRFVPGMRYLIFAYRDPASGRPRLSTYQVFKAISKPPP